jgi:protein-S-isoprenylcysteine O-methyltransferase Ste14
MKRALPPTYLLLGIVAIVALHLLLPLRQILVFPWRPAGAVLLLAGPILNLVADRQFKQHGTTVKPFERPASLITDGVYRLSRNPMYLGFVLILLGIAILLGTVTSFVVVLMFALLMEYRFIRVEEAMMEETFGEAWQTYKARVRRWI